MAIHTLVDNRTVNRSYIVFDGMDLTGKTTCIEKVKEELTKRHYNVLLTKGFGGGPLGKHIRQEFIPTVVNDIPVNKHSTEYEILAAALANMDAYENDVLPALAKGQLVISDRALSCFYAYQVEANTDKSVSYVTDAEEMASKCFKGMFTGMQEHPGLYLFFKCSKENYLKRKEKRKESNILDHRGYEYMLRVYNGYKKFSTMYGGFAKKPELYWIDADQPVEEVVSSVIKIVDAYLSKYYVNP